MILDARVLIAVDRGTEQTGEYLNPAERSAGAGLAVDGGLGSRPLFEST